MLGAKRQSMLAATAINALENRRFIVPLASLTQVLRKTASDNFGLSEFHLTAR
jgi:hypothetical protein